MPPRRGRLYGLAPPDGIREEEVYPFRPSRADGLRVTTRSWASQACGGPSWPFSSAVGRSLRVRLVGRYSAGFASESLDHRIERFGCEELWWAAMSRLFSSGGEANYEARAD
eukprot:1848684-Pyramimonas_sp.AAC.1